VWTLSPEPTLTIGQTDGEREYLFSRIRSAILLPGGRIGVVDQHAEGIRVFSPEGIFEREIGRRGEGPGEFVRLSVMRFVPPDTILVHDSRLYRLTKFLTTGELLSVHRLQAVDGFPEIYLGAFSTGDLGFGWIRQGEEYDYRLRTDVMQLARFNETGQLIHRLGSHDGMIRAGSSPLAFSPHLHAEMIGDSVFLTDGLLPEVEVWDDQGNLVRTIDVPISPPNPEEAWAALEDHIRTEGNDHQRRWLGEQPTDYAIPRISMMQVDDENRLWLKKYESPADSHLYRGRRCIGGNWLIVELSGEVIATIDLPEGFLLLDIRGNRALGLTQDDLDVERLQLFEVVRPD
jgi:hypothetical protein